MNKTAQTNTDDIIQQYYDSSLSLRQNATLISEKSGVTVGKDRIARWLKLHQTNEVGGAHDPQPIETVEQQPTVNQYWSAERVIKAINRLTANEAYPSSNQMMIYFLSHLNSKDFDIARQSIHNPDAIEFINWYRDNINIR